MLDAYLRNAVEHVIAVANEHGIGPELPSIPYTIKWMEMVTNGRLEGKRLARSEPAFFLLWKAHESQFKEGAAFKSLEQAAAEFARREGKLFPVSFAYNHGERLLFAFFNRVRALRMDEVVLKSLCKEYQDDLRSDTVLVRAVYQVHGFRTDKPFALASCINFRQIDDQDIDAYGRDSVDPFGVIPKPSDQHIYREDWVCVIEERVSKSNTEDLHRHSDQIEDIASALTLTIEGKALFSLQESAVTSPFVAIGKTIGDGRKIATSRHGEPISLEPEDVERFCRNFAHVTRIKTDGRLAFLRLPLRRLRLSSARTHDEDHLVDCIIALENMLASDSPQMETTFRFRLRGAAILPKEFGTIRQRIRLMSRLYSLRSKTVHGAKRDHGRGRSSDEIIEQVRNGAREAEKVLRAILMWFVERSAHPQRLGQVPEDLDEAMVEGGQTWAQRPQA